MYAKAQPSPSQPSPQPSPAQPSPPKGYGLLAPSPGQPSPPRRPGQPSPSPAHKPQAQSSHQHRSGQATAEPSPAQAVVWALPKLCQRLFLTGFRGAILGRRSAPFLVGLGGGAFRRLGSAASFLVPAQPRPVSLAQPSPAQALVWALPKLCQRLFLTGFRGAILGRRSAPFLLRFWPVWGRRAAAFRRFEG